MSIKWVFLIIYVFFGWHVFVTSITILLDITAFQVTVRVANRVRCCLDPLNAFWYNRINLACSKGNPIVIFQVGL